MHGNFLTDAEWDLLAGSGGTVTITPSTDMLMQFGTYPSTGAALSRGISADTMAPTVDLHQRDMLRLATIGGARVWHRSAPGRPTSRPSSSAATSSSATGSSPASPPDTPAS